MNLPKVKLTATFSQIKTQKPIKQTISITQSKNETKSVRKLQAMRPKLTKKALTKRRYMHSMLKQTFE